LIPRGLGIAVAALLAATAALGGYVLSLKRHAEQTPTAALASRPVTPPTAGPAVQVTLFLASDSEGVLHKHTTPLALPEDTSKRACEILRALLAQYQEAGSPHPLAKGAEINDVYVLSNHLAVIDANAALADGHRSGILVEELTLASMAQTLAANIPGVTDIKILIDGKERMTLAGHADLSEPYKASDAAGFVKE
jgi:hypothetical protein